MTPKQREAVDALEDHGSLRKAAKALGIAQGSLRNRLASAKKWEEADPSVQGAMSETGMQDAGILHSGWIKSDGASLYFQMPEQEDDPDDLAERIVDRINKVKPAPSIIRPKITDADKLNFVPIYDVHMGMRIGDYGTTDAVKRVKEGVMDVIDRAPRTETLILLNGGDFAEANDNSAQTPASKHPLAVDMEFDDLSDVATDVTVELIEYALSRADHVVYQAIKANHDPAMSLILRQALRQRYKDEHRFALKDGLDIFAHEWKGNFITGIHGHQKVSNPKDLALSIISRFKSEHGRCKRSDLYRGHLHNEEVITVPGLRINRVNAICPAGRYAKENMFEGESDVKCVTYKAGGGRSDMTIHMYDD